MKPNTVRIDGPHTRRIVTCALWRVVSERIVGEGQLSDACFSAGWRAVHPLLALETEPAEAEYRLARMAIIRAAIRRVAGCPEGSEIALPVSRGELAEALHDCVFAVDQCHELLASLSSIERDEVIACRDAGTRLLERLRSEPRGTEPQPGSTEPQPAWPPQRPAPCSPLEELERDLERDLGPGVSVPDFGAAQITVARARGRTQRRTTPLHR